MNGKVWGLWHIRGDLLLSLPHYIITTFVMDNIETYILFLIQIFSPSLRQFSTISKLLGLIIYFPNVHTLRRSDKVSKSKFKLLYVQNFHNFPIIVIHPDTIGSNSNLGLSQILSSLDKSKFVSTVMKTPKYIHPRKLCWTCSFCISMPGAIGIF